MADIEIPMDVEVHSIDGPYGRSRWVVLDPVKEKITHIVVEEHKSPHAKKLIPIHFVQVTSRQRINLMCWTHQLDTMSDFVETEFLPSGSHMPRVMLWPYVEPGRALTAAERERTLAGEIGIRRGTSVQAADGPIGHVGELMMDGKSGNITHLVLREGHLWGKRDICISVADIKTMDARGIHLRLAKKEVETLQEMPVRRPHR